MAAQYLSNSLDAPGGMLLVTGDVSRLSPVHCSLIRHLVEYERMGCTIMEECDTPREYDAYVKWL